MKVQIEAMVLRTVELDDVSPDSLRRAKDRLCLDHNLEDCQFTARWIPEGKKREKEQVIR